MNAPAGQDKQDYNVCAVIVRARADEAPAVSRRLSKLPGVDVHGQDGQGKLVVTIEDSDAGRASDMLIRLHSVEGVLAASLVYHHHESMGSERESKQ